jgi:hypothetical protein
MSAGEAGPESPFAWVRRDGWLGEGACLTLTDGGDPLTVLAQFSPVEDVSPAEGLSRATKGEPVVAVTALEPHGVLALQLNCAAGLRHDLLSRLSGDGGAATVQWSVNADARVVIAQGGRVVLDGDPVTGQLFGAAEPQAAAALEDLAAQPDPVAATLALSGERLGVHWSAETLTRFAAVATVGGDALIVDEDDAAPDFGLGQARARLRMLDARAQAAVARAAARDALAGVGLDQHPVVRQALQALDAGRTAPTSLGRFARAVAAEARRATMRELEGEAAPPNLGELFRRRKAMQALEHAFRAVADPRPLPAVMQTMKAALLPVLPNGYGQTAIDGLVDRWLTGLEPEET